jgi:porphobilinogen deaminase
LHDDASSLDTAAERTVMRMLGGSCVVPMGALARWNAETRLMALDGFFASDDGTRHARAQVEGPVHDVAEARSLGVRLAMALRL